MPRVVLRIAAILPLLSLACADAGPRSLTPEPAGADSRPLTPVLAWSLPERCVSRFYEKPYNRLENKSPVLIKNSAELSKHVECAEGFKADFDFDAEWIAMFPLMSRSGGSFKALSIKDDGKTLTLDVETRHYCGGTAPPTETETFFYRVPQQDRALAIKLVPAEQPPCSPNIP